MGKGYVHITNLKDYIVDLFDNWYVVAACEFLRITPKKIKPYMEYSLWKNEWYTLSELLREVDWIKNNVLDKWFKEEEIYFEVLVKNSTC